MPKSPLLPSTMLIGLFLPRSASSKVSSNIVWEKWGPGVRGEGGGRGWKGGEGRQREYEPCSEQFWRRLKLFQTRKITIFQEFNNELC